MGPHEEFLELCAAATAGELKADERARLDTHLKGCPKCRQAMGDYEVATQAGVRALAEEDGPKEENRDDSWSVQDAERAFLRRLDRDEKHLQSTKFGPSLRDKPRRGQRFTYRPSQIRWREVWMPFAAAVLLALALGIAAYRSGVKKGTDSAQTLPVPARDSTPSPEEQSSDMGYERAQLAAKLDENAKTISALQRQLSEQLKVVNGLKSGSPTADRSSESNQQNLQTAIDLKAKRDEELAAAQLKLVALQKTLDAATEQRDEAAKRAAVMEAKVNELTEFVQDRDRELDHRQEEVAKQQELLEHDRDIRELMGARDLYIVEVHDVSGTGQTNKTYGRVFYTKGKRLIFYAYELDAHPGIRALIPFTWGRRGRTRSRR
jgi:hypothetical protein